MTLKIRECDWEITTRCNLKCKHCLIKKSKAELNTKECIQVIDNLFNLGCKKITFTGGEPLIKKDIMKIIEHSQKKGIENWIFTNGTLINKKNINQIKKFITYIGFSLEGFENENDILRGKGSFKQTLRAITLVKDKNIHFGVYLTLNKYNYLSIKKILGFFRSLDPINISINEMVKRGNATKNKNQIFIKINKKSILGEVRSLYKDKFYNSKICQIVPGKFVIDSVGNIYGCTEIKQLKPSKVLGNILKNQYAEYMDFIKHITHKRNSGNSCPYECYYCKNLSLNFLSGKSCSLIK